LGKRFAGKAGRRRGVQIPGGTLRGSIQTDSDEILTQAFQLGKGRPLLSTYHLHDRDFTLADGQVRST
jgi:hypothetical protein